MLVTLTSNVCTVRREPGSPRIPRARGSWASNPDSTFWHRVCQALQKQGFNVIRRRLSRDGHMVGDDTTQYIRERKHRFYIYDGSYALRFAHEAYNAGEIISLHVQRNEPRKGIKNES